MVAKLADLITADQWVYGEKDGYSQSLLGVLGVLKQAHKVGPH